MQQSPIRIDSKAWTDVSASLAQGATYTVQNKDIQDVLMHEGPTAPPSDDAALILAPRMAARIKPDSKIWVRSLTGSSLIAVNHHAG